MIYGWTFYNYTVVPLTLGNYIYYLSSDDDRKNFAWVGSYNS